MSIWQNCWGFVFDVNPHLKEIMKLRVISDSDRVYLGTIEAVVGMELREGYKITKVNQKSIYFLDTLIFDSEGRIEKRQEGAIWYTEALNWGYPQLEPEEHQVQIEARNERYFSQGEWWFYRMSDARGRKIESEMKEKLEKTILIDPVKKAGYEFASATYTLRKLVLDNFK